MGKPEYVLPIAKSSDSPYKMISQTPNQYCMKQIKRRLQEVYSFVATDVHVATDLLRKQHADESLHDYIVYWTGMCHSGMKCDPANIDNKLVIVLFIKNFYNKDIRCRVAGAKNVNTILDAFKMAHWKLLKLKKYKGLVSEDDSIHSIHTVSQVSDISKLSVHFSKMANVDQTLFPGQDGQFNSANL